MQDPDGPISICTYVFLAMKQDGRGAQLWFQHFTCQFMFHHTEMVWLHVMDRQVPRKATWTEEGNVALVSDHTLVAL